MEERVLHGYLDFRKRSRKNAREILRKLGFGNKIAFVIVCLAPFVMLLSVLLKTKTLEITIIAFLIEVVCLLFIQKNMQKISCENSIEKLEELDVRYKDTLEWLKTIGYGEKNQIKQLCRRCENLLEKREQKKKDNEDKLFKMIVVPTYLALVAGVLTASDDIIVNVAIVIILMGALMWSYIIINDMKATISEIWDNSQEDLKDMVDDLHGVLDRCFVVEEEDIIN